MGQEKLIAAERLRAFFHPRSIAVVGASDASRWSSYLVQNLRASDFTGPLYLINPRRAEVHGQATLPTLSALPEPVDLAFVMVPTAQVLPVIAEGAMRGVRHFVVLTAGFRETGPQGAAQEQELLTFAQTHDLLILGPNGNGFINASAGITPYGLPINFPLRRGPVAVVLQSGALASAVLAFAQAHAIGLSLLVSLGNEGMIGVCDVLEYLLNDHNTRAVALFLESVRQPEALRRLAARALAQRCALVALQVGRSEAGSRSAAAHTGALVGNAAVNAAALRQLGMISVSSLEDLLTTAALAAYYGPLPGRRLGAVTPSGGACDLIADRAQDEGLLLPAWSGETCERLRAVLPPFATPHNPLDVTGYVVVDGTLQQRALAIVREDPQLDFVLNVVSIDGLRRPTPEGQQALLSQYEHLAELVHTSPRPIVLVSNTCVDLPAAMLPVVERTGLHIMAGLEHGLRALGRLLWWSEQLSQSQQPDHEESAPTPALTLDSIRPPASVPEGSWSEVQTRSLLEQAGIPLVPAQLVHSPTEALAAAHHYGFPVVLKLQSATVLHKSDLGGVALNLRSDEEVASAFQRLLAVARQHMPESTIEGILVSPMRPAGCELLVSVFADQVWGLTLTVGLGGLWTEVLHDIALRPLPLSRREILTMLAELRGFPLLQGLRNQPGVNLERLSAVIHRISLLAQGLAPYLDVLEINPLWATGDQVEVLDALVIWRTPEKALPYPSHPLLTPH
ncbi:acetate--CoA ligase family protein [Thermogemmatispora sp.]|uniref:acetate--CoA ligase family protein n=1 Tax=Thermogemmatispora sp. TaxID=1968838 RepID=UPI001D809969|nr:acetate--CoA ligase family protein [Thermogemmatispora sp.]MBX5450462.1 acetate--CoA ligase family protein [Thermogemmatispora sp.]